MKIAIIGGIGSGKSRVLEYIKDLGQRVCDCDAIYKDIVKEKEYIKLVGDTFGVVKDGAIDKKALANIVFSDKEQLKKLNSLAHPLIFQKIHNIYKEDNTNLYIEVSAFDNSMAEHFDEIVYVKSLQSNRVERVKLRNNYDEDYILSIMSNQLCEEEMEKASSFVLINDGDLEELAKQVEYLIAFLQF